MPSFFIESFRVPPFLLPIYQAAGIAYGIPWQVLAAINEVETDYGRDLSVSSAGAEGWMQFLPSSWAQYGVDANNGGVKDPYNPADAIFAAAAYLRAAGGNTNIRAAVYAYNHSQAYVTSVMLRAQLLGGTPPELLGCDHRPDRGPLSGARSLALQRRLSEHCRRVDRSPPTTLVGTTIYSQVGAPVIAVQDGEIVQIGDSPELGRFVSLRDAYGDTYVYAAARQRGRPVPGAAPGQASPSTALAAASRCAQTSPERSRDGGRAAALVGVRSRPPRQGLRWMGTTGAAVAPVLSAAAAGGPGTGAPPRPPAAVRVFREGPNEVYLHPLRVGVQVLAGTVLGHVGGRLEHARRQRRSRAPQGARSARARAQPSRAAHLLPDPPVRRRARR